MKASLLKTIRNQEITSQKANQFIENWIEKTFARPDLRMAKDLALKESNKTTVFFSELMQSYLQINKKGTYIQVSNSILQASDIYRTKFKSVIERKIGKLPVSALVICSWVELFEKLQIEFANAKNMMGSYLASRVRIEIDKVAKEVYGH